MTQYVISKRAGLAEALEKFIPTVWNFDRGPAENLLRVLPYVAIPFLGSIGQIAGYILTIAASQILGISPADIGRLIDNYFGWGPGDDPRDAGIRPKLEQFINNLFAKLHKKRFANYIYSMSKTASVLSALVAGGKIGKWLVMAMYKLVQVMASVFVFSHLGKFTKELTEPLREQVSEWAGKPEPSVKPTALEELKKQLSPSREPVEVSSKEKEVSQMLEKLEEKYGLK